jgi:UDP-3-O-[3-hydroxymyristoyl] glucosamine N-acyltransferase
MTEYTVSELAGFCAGRPEGDASRRISGVSSTQSATVRDLAFGEDARGAQAALESSAGCVILRDDVAAPGRTVIRHPQPKLAFARLAARVCPPPRPAAGVHPKASVEESAKLAAGVHVGASAVVGAGAVIGKNTVISAGVVVGDGCRIGEDCWLHPRVTLYPGVTLANRVVLHAGVVIGGDGFGYVFNGKSYEKFPQLGTVEIGDDVEIGANTTVDRGALGVTRVGSGSKIDNLVQVGHNVIIGEHTVIASLVGISGSCEIGHHVTFAGQVGLGDHVRIEPNVVLGGQCGVLPHKTVKRGQVMWGTPARPIKDYLRQLATLSRLAKR